MTLDVVIRNGTVVDGSGGPARDADVGIKDGVVVDIGKLDGVEAAELIDATDRFVTPGFIDIHSHSDYTLLRDPRAMSALYQGVTLEVIGNCGHGCFPIADRAAASISIYGHHEDTPLDWNDASGYFDRLQAAGPAVNVLSLVPHGQLRLATIGLAERSATSEEIAAMAGVLEQSLDQGAWGLSTGLEYPVEKGSTESEITELCGVVARRDGLYATHTRARDDGSVEAVAEAIRTAGSAGVRLQVSHLLPRNGLEAGRRCIELVDAAVHDHDVAFDMHTRLHGLRYLHTLLPTWALDGGRQKIAERLADPRLREQLKQTEGGFPVADWSAVTLLDSRAWPEFGRRPVSEISAERGDTDVLDTVYDLLMGAAGTGETLIIISHCHTKRQQREAFAHALCMPGSDATTLATDGTLAGETFHGAYTWAAWFYRYMVRDTGLLTPEEAIRKLSGAPAKRLGLHDRGLLREGARADLVVLDPSAYGEKGTLFEPNQLSTGIDHVLVNGVSAIRAGELTGRRAGAVLRRG